MCYINYLVNESESERALQGVTYTAYRVYSAYTCGTHVLGNSAYSKKIHVQINACTNLTYMYVCGTFYF